MFQVEEKIAENSAVHVLLMGQTIEQVLQKGVAAHKEGRFQEAEDFYRAILQSQPAHPDANHNLGILAVASNQPNTALRLFQTALESDPNIEIFWHSYVDALVKTNQLKSAKKMVKKAAKKGFNHKKLKALLLQSKNHTNTQDPPKAQIRLILDYYQNGRYLEAEKLALIVTQKFPQHQFAWKALGTILRKVGRANESLTAGQKSVELAPKDAEAHNNLGNTLKELGRLREAKESFIQAIACRSDYAIAHYNLGSILKEQGRYDKAEESYCRAITLKPDLAEVHNNLGIMLEELGRLDEAEASYSRAIASKPDYTEAHSNLGNVLKGLGRDEESVSCFRQAFANRTGIRPMGDYVLSPAITSIYFELTNKCNFHCSFCPSDDQKRSLGYMDLELVKRLYEESADKKIANVVNLHLMGEPTLHPQLIEILKFGASKNIKTDLVTNISTLVDKNISKILDSLYGTLIASHMTPTKETYHFRGDVGLSWDRYTSNLRSLVREYMKRLAEGVQTKSSITIRVMVTQNTASNVNIIGTSNEAGSILQEWYEFVAEIERELGIPPFNRQDLNIEDVTRGNNYSNTSYLLQQGITLKFWRAFTFANTRVSDQFDLQPTRQSSYCSKPFTNVGVLWNGDVTLCDLDHDGELKVGNIRDSSIETMIQSDAAQELRSSMLGESPLPSICQKCQERPFQRRNEE
ncbi:MAG: hypothetical protein CBD27_02635 [Rhodospirillaceae bacterium TMED167]|nr:MAG: hypothetical protein CBD27_02635 [Rhodospirillaceae bacterium TMED167]